MFPTTPWSWLYWPVRNVARDGAQSEKLAKLLSKVVPDPPRSRFTLSITRIDSTVWSSVMITTMFGRTAVPTAFAARVRGAAHEIARSATSPASHRPR